ncbi:secretory phospholipase A2 receptor-like [Seriola dumerili]|uniref:secretory phospholipase A2 receptor-like n=1 Tax=Seriola dumerili TaxID=41447 RepID=UPI000BBE91B0|nr:secretory phospholipase A2 receptor-like [Seriola dumerili]
MLMYLQVGGLRAAKFKHYSYFNYKRTWAEAQVFCRRNHTDLVTIRNEEENRAFLNIYGWIGLYREDSNSPWKWSRGGEIANFITWVSGAHHVSTSLLLLLAEPDSGDHCGFKYSTTKEWRSGPCEDKRGFLCFDKKLVLVKEKRTWETALKYCRNMGALDTSNPVSDYQNHRYDLATLITQDDHDFARETAREAVTGEVRQFYHSVLCY